MHFFLRYCRWGTNESNCASQARCNICELNVQSITDLLKLAHITWNVVNHTFDLMTLVLHIYSINSTKTCNDFSLVRLESLIREAFVQKQHAVTIWLGSTTGCSSYPCQDSLSFTSVKELCWSHVSSGFVQWDYTHPSWKLKLWPRYIARIFSQSGPLCHHKICHLPVSCRVIS